MLTSLRVENYKSLEKADIQLGPVTVLIGPNNSGKSNILDCFAFLGELIRNGSTAVESRGGFFNTVFRNDTKRSISMAFSGSESEESQRKKSKYTYEIIITGSPSRWQITNESFTVEAGDGTVPILQYFPGEGAHKIRSLSGEPFMTFGGSPERSLLSWIASMDDARVPRVLRTFAVDAGNWVRFSLSPAAMRGATSIRRDLLLASDGNNVATVLHELHTRHRFEFDEVERTLRSLAPEVTGIVAGTGQPGQTYLEMREGNVLIPAWNMPDGLLRFIALLTLVYSPGSPGVVCLEEPENYLHPHALRLAAEVLQAGSSQRQFIYTTHSPLLLDCVDIKQLRIVEKKGSATTARPVRGRAELRKALESLGLGEAWYSGLIGGVRE